MSDNTQTRSSAFSLPNIFLLVALAAGLLFYRPPLQDTRPTSDTAREQEKSKEVGLSNRFHRAEVPLWQDPFLKVDEIAQAGRVTAQKPARDTVRDVPLWKPAADGPGKVRVVFAMEEASRNPESVEQRLRSRQALHAALRSEALTPMHPSSMLHLVIDKSRLTGEDLSPAEFLPRESPPVWQKGAGFGAAAVQPVSFALPRPIVSVPFMPEARSASGGQAGLALGRDSFISGVLRIQESVSPPDFSSDGHARVYVFPYEWFSQDEVALRAGYQCAAKHVLLIWLPEGQFLAKNLHALHWLLNELIKQLRSDAAPQDAGDPLLAPPKAASLRLPTLDEPMVWRRAVGLPGPTAPAVPAASAGHTATAAQAEPAGDDGEWPSFALVGPTSSSTLLSMWGEADEYHRGLGSAQGQTSLRDGLHVYAPTPSAEAFYFSQSVDVGVSLASLEASFDRELQVRKFQRVCQTDETICDALIQELTHRGLNIIPTSAEWSIAKANHDGEKLDTIALISEHGSYFGRAFPQTFNAQLWHRAERDGKTYGERDVDWRLAHAARPPHVHIYFYPQGLDAPTAQSGRDRADGADTARPSAVAPRIPEFPEGPGQLDYIRRLARSLSAEYRRAGRNRLRAIGIIGTDVYDKILMLQALRVEFPDILFFTTDLDARLMHHRNFGFTRNLIVASTYGLTLRDRYQQTSGIAAFRDSGQTARYVAARLAVSERPDADRGELRYKNPEYHTILAKQVAESILRPLVFEVGRETVIPLSPLEQSEDSLHPPPHPTLGRGYWFLVLAAWCLFLALLVYVFPPVRDRLSYFGYQIVRRSRLYHWSGADVLVHEEREQHASLDKLRALRTRLLVGVAVIAIATGLPLYVMMPISHFMGGEPFALLDGVSVWPTVAVTHAAFALTVWFLIDAWYCVQRVEQKLDIGLHLSGMQPAALPYRSGLLVPLSMWSLPAGSGGEGRVDVHLLWRQFRALSATTNRFARVGTLFFVLALFWLVMYLLFGEANEPVRGARSLFAIRSVTFAAMTALAVLTLFVVDATSLVLAFVRNLGRGSSYYDLETLRAFWERRFTAGQSSDEELEERDDYLHCIKEFADISLIADLTGSVFHILLYPFIVLTLLILSRSSLFDNFVWAYVVLAVYGMLFAVALWCALMLQRTAGRERRSTVTYVRKKLDAAKRRKNDQRTKVSAIYESSIRQIEAIQDGAFMSLYDNPILRAILLPTGGTTLIALLQYLAVL